MSRPRLLALMGSGETSPTMVKTHRSLIERVGGPAVMLDTPYGFQTNADELSARAVGYFADSVGVDMAVVGYRSADQRGSVSYEQAMDRLRQASYVFAGPGSPSYALSQWHGSAVPDLLADKLRVGGCVTFASAAALTLGTVTVPVYEVYKVGADPHWLDGLDVLAAIGLQVAVIPHYDNAEGGNHDTRFCYLGEERLAAMEAELGDDAFVLGIDEHTGAVLDLDAETATVVGRGGVTVRARGRSVRWEAGATVSLAELRGTADRLRTGSAPPGDASPGRVADAAAAAPAEIAGGGREGQQDAAPLASGGASSPMLEATAAAASRFDEALGRGDTDAAVQAILDLEGELQAWAADPTQSDELDRARSSLRSLVVRLGEVARTGARDPRDVVGPFVEVVLGARTDARSDRRFAEADALRDRLVELGVEVNDTPDGTEWSLRG